MALEFRNTVLIMIQSLHVADWRIFFAFNPILFFAKLFWNSRANLATICDESKWPLVIDFRTLLGLLSKAGMSASFLWFWYHDTIRRARKCAKFIQPNDFVAFSENITNLFLHWWNETNVQLHLLLPKLSQVRFD
jgi:hypothetical protein